LSIFSLEKHYN